VFFSHRTWNLHCGTKKKEDKFKVKKNSKKKNVQKSFLGVVWDRKIWWWVGGMVENLIIAKKS